MSTVKISKTEHLGWPNCIKISNDIVELIVTTDVGPRIIHYGFKGGPNHMKVFCEQAGKTGADEWMSYGGHRLWHSPEERPRTYDEDNFPCEWKKVAGGIWTRSVIDPWTQVEKEMEILLDPDSTQVTINHRITNRNAWDIEYSVWCLTVMEAGGLEIIPQISGGPELLPNRTVALWSYSKMNDPRVHWLDKYIMLEQDVKAKTPFKVGLPVPDGWVAYANFGQLFVKRFDFIEDADYPDFGLCSFETYTNSEMTELESLSPLWLVEPGDGIEHVEVWELHDQVERPGNEKDIEKMIMPIIKGGKTVSAEPDKSKKKSKTKAK
ncbi:MAG: hypothetical protein ACYCYI_02955 [Saccharofermentanales bacterium]